MRVFYQGKKVVNVIKLKLHGKKIVLEKQKKSFRNKIEEEVFNKMFPETKEFNFLFVDISDCLQLIETTLDEVGISFAKEHFLPLPDHT